MKGILGQKIGMTQIFDQQGISVPVTVVEVQPNIVLSVKTQDKNGYDATQLAAVDKRESLLNKPNLGQYQKINKNPKRFVKEIRNMKGFQPAQKVKVDIFTSGEFVDVQAISKGKGFAGVIKRHNQSIGPKSHGSHYKRAIGSMGAIAPNRVFKSKNMPGHMGHEKVTVQNLEVIKIDIENNYMLIKGSVPGPKKSLLVVKENIKHKKPTTPFELLKRTTKKQESSKEVVND